MSANLEGMTIAMLATDGFEQSELEEPRDALESAGATVVIVSPEGGEIRGWDEDDFGDSVEVDETLDETNPDDFDALILPGGVMNPDKLRTIPEAIEFVEAFFKAGKPVGAICHGPQILINAGLVRGRRLTSYPSIRRDLENAGANWVDEVVVADDNLVTSRTPDDLPQFCDKVIAVIAAASHSESVTNSSTLKKS